MMREEEGVRNGEGCVWQGSKFSSASERISVFWHAGLAWLLKKDSGGRPGGCVVGWVAWGCRVLQFK